MRPEVAANISESEFAQAVQSLLDVFGWAWIATRPARRRDGSWVTPTAGPGAKGWPDLFCVRGDDVIALELKSMRGRATVEQQTWIARLTAAGIEATVVRPSDLDWIEQRLRPRYQQLTTEHR